MQRDHVRGALILLRFAWTFLLAALAGPALAEASDKLKSAVRTLEAGRCEEVRDVINAGLKEGDRDIYFLAGFMFARGMCVAPDTARAAKLLEAAAKAAQPDAAMELVLMHGTGRGVAQSYAQAGRWAQAAVDIGALVTCPQKPAELGCAAPRTLDVDYATSLGYLGTIHALVTEDVRANRRLYLRQVGDFDSVTHVRVTLVWPALTVRVTTAKNDAPLKDVPVHLRGSKPLGVMFKEAYDNAIAAAAPAPCVRESCPPVQATRDYGFRFE